MQSIRVNKFILLFSCLLIFIIIINILKIISTGNFKIAFGVILLVFFIVLGWRKKSVSFPQIVVFFLPFWDLNIYGGYFTVSRIIILLGIIYILLHNQIWKKAFCLESLLLFILTLLMLISIYWSSNFDRSRNILLNFILNSFFLFILLICFINSTKQLYSTFKLWFVIAILSAIISIFQIIFGEVFFIQKYLDIVTLDTFYGYKIEGVGYSGFGIFLHRGYNALFLCVAFLIGFTNVLFKKWNAILSLPFLLIIVIAILTSGSRFGAYLLFITVITALFLQVYINNKINKNIFNLFLFAFLAIFSWFLLFNPMSPFSQKIFRGTFKRFESRTDSRVELWRSMMKRIESPFSPMGLGLGETSRYLDVVEMHNAYLEILVEVGFIGFIIWMLFVWRSVKYSFKLLLSLRKNTNNQILYIISIVFLFIILQNLVIGMSIERGDLLIILPFAIVTVLAKQKNNLLF